MADDEQSKSGLVPGLVQDFIAQLRAVTEGLEGLAGSGARRPLAPGTFPLPGALSAAQVTAISGSVAAQRKSIEALKAQLSSFDEQLAVLEQILSPLSEWSRTWAELEERLLKMSRGPAADSPDNSLRPERPARGMPSVIGGRPPRLWWGLRSSASPGPGVDSLPGRLFPAPG
jgi:hypothetical protein